MKATAWFCPVLLTLLCATRFVCTAQRGGYPLDYADSNAIIQDDYLVEKRNKPSLSIVNPLDVLRQRLLLEIARRQMKENTRQVEMNRAILKNIGKRMMSMPATRRYQQMTLQQQLQLERQRQRMQQQRFPNQMLEFEPTTNLLDFLQQQQEQQPIYNDMLDDAKKSLNARITKHQQHHQLQQHLNGNGIGNETNNENGNDGNSAVYSANSGGQLHRHSATATGFGLQLNDGVIGDAGAGGIGDGGLGDDINNINGNNELNFVDFDDDAAAVADDDVAPGGTDGFRLRYLYRFHNNKKNKNNLNKHFMN